MVCVRCAEIVDPRLVVHADGIDNKCIALVMANGFAVPGPTPMDFVEDQVRRPIHRAPAISTKQFVMTRSKFSALRINVCIVPTILTVVSPRADKFVHVVELTNSLRGQYEWIEVSQAHTAVQTVDCKT